MATGHFRSLEAGLAASVAALVCALALGVQSASAKVYFSSFPAEGGTGIERAGFEGGSLETLTLQPVGFDEGLALNVAEGKMYWTDSIASVIYRANLNGSEAQVIYDDLGWEPLGIALDPARGEIYWNDRQGIKRASVDGTHEELLVEGATSGLLALDLPAQHMYWIAGGKIKGAAMEPNPAVSEPVSGQVKPFGLAVDPEHGWLYWLELERNQIRRSNLEGGEIETIVDQPEAGFEGGLAIEPAAGRLYWTAAGSEAAPYDQIEVSNLAGGEARTLFATGADIPEALAVENAEERPLDTLAPLIEGTPQVGSPLSCNPGLWSGIGAITASYRWLAGGAPIEGVSGPVYVPAQSQAGTSLACAVSATDNVETTTALSAPVSVAALAPPDEPPAATRAKLVAGIALANLTSSGTTAHIPVFTSLAGRATLSARPVLARGRSRRHARTARAGRAPRTVSAHTSLAPGRARITLRGLVRGATYRLQLSVKDGEGQVARSGANLRVQRRSR